METLSNGYINKEAVINMINHTAFRVDSIDDVIKLRERIKALPTINIPLNNSESMETLTKEEAITELETLRAYELSFPRYGETAQTEALKMAIEALKAEEE